MTLMTPTSTNTHILIVDDDKVMGELLEALLTLRGYEVTRARSGEEALMFAERLGTKVDIVLSDVHMPGLHGAELAGALKSLRDKGVLRSETVLLGMSGSAPKLAEERVFDAFLQKPFAIEDLAAAAEQASARRERVRTTGADDPSAGSSQAAVEARAADAGALPALEERTFSQLRSKIPDEQLRQLYAMTLEDVQVRLERIATAAKSGDEASVRHEAHAIKGGCGMVGAFELQELAAATEGGSAVDTSALANFAAACQRLQRMLDERL
jgi:CheY-like chemotaxis protein